LETIAGKYALRTWYELGALWNGLDDRADVEDIDRRGRSLEQGIFRFHIPEANND
jgi:hypothetical protein